MHRWSKLETYVPRQKNWRWEISFENNKDLNFQEKLFNKNQFSYRKSKKVFDFPVVKYFHVSAI